MITTLFCVGGVELFYKFIDHAYLQMAEVPPGTASLKSSPVGIPQKIKKNHDYRIILERNLFETSLDTSGADQKSDPLEGLKPTSLDVVLMGTVFGETEEKRAIILEKQKRKQEMYHVGDSVKGAIIKDILRGKVILDYNNLDEVLDMSEAEKYRTQTAVPEIPTRQFVDRPQAGSRQMAPANPRSKIVPPVRRFTSKK